MHMNATEMMGMFLRTEAFAKEHNHPKVAAWARKQYRKYRAIYTAGWGDTHVGRTAC